MTPAVYVVQLLCAQRHAVLAVAYVCQSEDEVNLLADVLPKHFAAAVDAKLLDPWCGLCHSMELHVETARTAWSTMEEAAPHLKAAEEANLQTAAMWKAGRN